MATRPQGGGRQKGTPNRATVAGRDLALLWGPDALRKLAHLAGLIRDPEGNPIGMADSHQVQLNACQQIIDRAYGKPTQPISGDQEFDPIRTVMRVEFVGEKPKDD